MKNENLYFSTYTNLNWITVLERDEYKEIIVDSLRFLVNNKRVVVYAFVIMPNHIHLLWNINDGFKLSDVQRDFLKYTSQKIKLKMFDLTGKIDPRIVVKACDRETQIWERKGLSFPLYKYDTIVQKLYNIHNNPINKKWRLCSSLEKYTYSSFKFYLNGDKRFEFLSDFYETDGVLELNKDPDTVIGVAC